MPNSATRGEVEDYAIDVLRNKIRCELPDCPFCNTSANRFRRHQARPRKFYILHDMLVELVVSLVIRWRCLGCKKTFTQQPPFALPRKRYTRETILDFSARYVEEEASPYRATVLEEGASFFHASTTKGDLPTRKELAHSTPYHWVTSLGALKEVVRCGQDILLQKDPASSVCRHLASLHVFARKYVKPARQWVLKRCRQILHLDAVFRPAFGTSIFPGFATRCAWG